MQKPDDIPEDVWAEAGKAGEAMYGRHERGFVMWPLMTKAHVPAQEVVARAILAERERCEAEWATKLMHAEAKAILNERDRCQREFRQQAMADHVHSPWVSGNLKPPLSGTL